jgi:AraC-like DNA-binding protein
VNYREQSPSPLLAAIVKHYWSLEFDGAGAELETILPDGCPELVFNLSDRFQRIDGLKTEVQPATLFAGQISRGISIKPTGKVDLFGVRFQPAGASALGKYSLHELTNRMFDINSVFGREGTQLEETVNLARNFESKIGVFESFVFNGLRRRELAATIAAAAIDVIGRHAGNISISRLIEHLNISERGLERSFREHIGLPPKKFARIVRFQNVVRTIEGATDTTMLDTALSYGYFDQSHMIRDFREFSGKSPLEYFTETHRMSALFTAAG